LHARFSHTTINHRTTTHLTTAWAESLSHIFGLSEPNKFFEFLVRGVRFTSVNHQSQKLPRVLIRGRQLFFLLNLVFNAIMWGLFTRALTLASSTTRVSVINTSANFIITAILGVLIFSETLPALWLLGAAMLVAGSVIIGRREEGKETGNKGAVGSEQPVAAIHGFESTPFADDPDAPLDHVNPDREFEDTLKLRDTESKKVSQWL
jgi:uncharacterized membrane protein